MIVVEIGDGVGQHADAAVGDISHLLRLLGVLGGALRLLLDFNSLRIHGLDAGLRTGVDVLDVAGVLRSQVVKLVGLVDQRRRLTLDLILARAADGGHHAGCQAHH